MTFGDSIRDAANGTFVHRSPSDDSAQTQTAHR